MTTYGAQPGDWDQLSLLLGLTGDLLPVVSDPTAKISKKSNMQGVGKTPSIFNRQGEVVGIKGWTEHISTNAEIERWMKNDRLGICIQTRHVRAIDIDVEDAGVAAQVRARVSRCLGELPLRTRSNSSKCLLLLELPGDLRKRVIKVKGGGLIEFLGSGNQCVVSGTHTSGVRYEWAGGLPDDIPEISMEKFEALWADLAATFGEDSGTIQSASPNRTTVLNSAIGNDTTATYLVENGWVRQTARDGALHITCPFEDGHSSPNTISSTSYFPAHTNGYASGAFKCLHASCKHRTQQDFKDEIGTPTDNGFSDFDNIAGVHPDNIVHETQTDQKPERPRFTVIPAHEFAAGKPPEWIIKGVLPKAELGVVYGSTASGKSFFVLDMLGAIVTGTPWRGHNVKQGRAVYVVAEGAGGFRSRITAYDMDNGVCLGSIGLGIIPDAPDVMAVPDVRMLIASIQAYGPISVVVLDTMAQVMTGDENSGEDVGRVIRHCKAIHKATGALVLLVHHAGKDTTKGARGHSSLKAACDVEIEVTRCEGDHVAIITKLKDGREGLEFGFKLKDVRVGVDDDDLQEVFSCVVEPTNAQKVTKTKVKPLGANEKLVLRCLDNMVSPGSDAVNWEDLKVAVIGRLVPPSQGERDRRKEAVDKAINALLASEMLEVEGVSVRRTEPPEEPA